jgi:glycosyltransferase involved in cell wall biosynthesis
MLSGENYSGMRSQLCNELGISESAKIILCVGRLAGYKRQDLVLEALAPICIKENLAILFVGKADESVNGTREMLVRIEEEVSKNALESRVKFLGQRSDVQALMGASDLLVHATNKEAFGLVLVEALALGLPVVSTNVEGIPEVLSGTDSIMVMPNDVLVLRQAVITALSRSSSEVVHVKERGKEHAKMFRQSERATKMIEFFEDVLSCRL